MAATKTEQPKTDDEVVTQKSFTKSEVVALYQKGQNLYQIAEAVYGFQSEEAVAKIREILGKSDEN